MVNISICTPITQRITTWRTLENGRATCNTSTCCLQPKMHLFTLIYQKKLGSQKTLKCASINPRLLLLSIHRGMCSYIKNLHAYLLSFTKKAQPLLDADTRQSEAALDFEKKWGSYEGWEDSSESKPQANGTNAGGIWCSACKIISLFHVLKYLIFRLALRSEKLY